MQTFNGAYQCSHTSSSLFGKHSYFCLVFREMTHQYRYLVVSVLLGAVLTVSVNDDIDPDPKGYLVYCPCMGKYFDT